MSGVVKAVGKVFSAVGKVIKKVLPAVLAIGAIVFTAGGALGLLPMLGLGGATLGGTAASIIGGLGIGTETLLGTVLTGALTGAASGAAIGGITAALTGGKISKGLEMGAMGGALTGGALSGLGWTGGVPESVAVTPHNPGLDISGASSSGVSGLVPNAGAGGPALSGPAGSAAAAPPGMTSMAGGGYGTSGASGAMAPPPAAPTSMLGKVWAEVKNSEFAGGIVKGLGQGLLASSENDAYLEGKAADRNAIAANYATSGTGLIRNGTAAATTTQPASTPQVGTTQPGRAAQQNTNASPINSPGRYQWDPVKQDIVWVPFSQRS